MPNTTLRTDGRTGRYQLGVQYVRRYMRLIRRNVGEGTANTEQQDAHAHTHIYVHACEGAGACSDVDHVEHLYVSSTNYLKSQNYTLEAGAEHVDLRAAPILITYVYTLMDQSMDREQS